MRVITGTARGRVLKTLPGEATRPTTQGEGSGVQYDQRLDR